MDNFTCIYRLVERFKSTDEQTTNLFEEAFFDFKVTVICHVWGTAS
jgi:hypothetical protein